MTIRLEEQDHVVCFWTADSMSGDNFMMMLRRRDDVWLLDYRFRIRRDDRVFDSADEKVFYEWRHKTEDVTEEEVVELAQRLFRVVGEEFYLHSFCQRVNGDRAKFQEVAAKYDSSFHTRVVSLEHEEPNAERGDAT